MIKISEIRIDGGTQSRAAINDETVADYAEAMQNPETVFPPITVYFDGKSYWLADGFHRVAAWERIGREEVPAEIRQGDRRKAILHSCGANAAHGLRRTNDDKRRAVTALLEDQEWSQWPDTKIAEQCRVGRNFVRKMRNELTCTPSASDPDPVYRKYIDKYGNERTMNVARIGSGNPKSRPLTEEESSLLVGAESPSVYVLQSGHRCKIGWSRGVRHRIEALLGQNPDATVVAIAGGGAKEERQVHKFLDCERDIGEWFIVTPEEAVEAMKRTGLEVTSRIGGASSPDQETPLTYAEGDTQLDAFASGESGGVDAGPRAPAEETPAQEPAQAAQTGDTGGGMADAAPDPHTKERRALAGLSREGLEDEVIGLRAALADEKSAHQATRAKLKEAREVIANHTADDKDEVIRRLSSDVKHHQRERFKAEEKFATEKKKTFALTRRVKELESMGIAL